MDIPVDEPLHFFDWHSELSIKRNNLPHWHQRGRVQFVTFRLADSLPSVKLQQLAEFKAKWVEEHPFPWDELEWMEYNEIIALKVDKWLDKGYGSCLLSKPSVRDVVVGALYYYNNKLYRLFSFVVMPNHVHVILSPTGDNDVRSALGLVKSYSAKVINKMTGGTGPFWQKEVFDRIIRNVEKLDKFDKYIRNNPKGLSDNTYTLFTTRELSN